MKKLYKHLYQAAAALCLATVSQGLVSCSEADSELVSFVEDNRINTPNDTVYSLMGIINKMQVIADRTVLLGELRGDLTSLTENADLDLQDLAAFKAGTSNPYNNARDYYAVIQNCNYFLANADTELAKRGVKVFEKEYAVVKAYRAWTYLQLAINYGEVPFFTQPLLAEKEADPAQYPHYNVEQIANYFIDDLIPYMDVEYPSYGSIGGINSQKFYIPIRVLIGDLCLWAGRYSEAAMYYHDYLTLQNNIHPVGTARAAWSNNKFENVNSSAFSSQFESNSTEVLTLIPMETDEYNGIESHLVDVFTSTDDNFNFYQATHSKAYDELSMSQVYKMIDVNPVTMLPDTIDVKEDIVYQPEYQKGDLRLISTYPELRKDLRADGNSSDLIQNCNKYRGTNVHIYRLQHVYLRYAEALNRAGYPQSAFAVLKYGLWKDNIEKYISEEERAEAGDLISFSEYTFTRNNTQGLHSRGSGDANGNKGYAIPELETKDDSILFVENAICDEMALETAAEGLRFYDLMRLSMHRNDPTFLAGKVAGRNGADAFDDDLFTFLSKEENWYLPIE